MRIALRTTLVAVMVTVCAGTAFAQGGVLLYTHQPASEPPYKQIHRMNADGTGDTTLTSLANGLNYPDWSPDASKITVCRYVSATVWSIYTMNANGSGLTRLTDSSNVFDFEPDWSPDGEKIVFTRMDTDYENAHLWLMNADGSDPHALGVTGSAPQWSPDGSLLIYHANRGGFYGIYVCDVDGTNEVPLLTSGNHEMTPAWSPDGSKVAFVSHRDGNPQIYVMNADGSGQTRLTENTARDYTPAWSPDGSLIAFDSDESGPLYHWEVYIIRADGSDRRRVTYTPTSATAINPDWMPQDLFYLGQLRPGLTPVRFAPDSLCANDDWFWHGSPVFSPDLKEMHWAKYVMYPTYHITELAFMELDENRWSPAQRPSFADTSYMENNPFFPASSDTLYFHSERPAGPIFRVTRTPSGWSAPEAVAVPPVPDTQNGRQFSLAGDGALYFELWSGTSCDLYRSAYVGGVYQTPEVLTALNTESYEFAPWVDPDERFILFDSNRPGGYGLNDMYISIKDEEGAWGTPVNLGATVNSSNEDAWPIISPDGLYFFFVTQKAGDAGYNPYWVDAELVYDFLPDTTAGVPVRTVSALYRGDCIEVTWTCSRSDEVADFEVLRAASPGDDFVPVPAATLQQDGLLFTFRDSCVERGATYRYQVRYDDGGVKKVLFKTEAIAVPAIPLALQQNLPNPFNPSTRIGFDVPARCLATLAIYDVRGMLVRTLVQGELEGGTHQASWDGLDSQGRPASSGLYFYRLTAGGESVSRKLVLMR
jgi:Tol biopolymer transport system component